MLDTLHIENIAVVRRADIDLTPGFTVLTGETGAGKSIIIDSINLLLGARPQRDLIRSGENTAVVSAVFSDIPRALCAQMAEGGIRLDDEEMLYLQRTVQLDGKASTRIGGRPVSVSQQKDLIGALVAIHGQHDNQLFLKPETHITYLDAYAHLDAHLLAYEACYRTYCDIKQKIKSLQRDELEKARMAELLRYQIADIDAARLKPKEEELLLAKKKKIVNTEKITKQVHTVYHSLFRSEKGYSASEQLSRAVSALDAIADVIPEAAAYSEKLNEYRYELEDIAETVQSYIDDSDGDPTQLLDKIEGRLETISKLKRKYGATVEGVLSYRAKIAEELDDITLSEEKIARLEVERQAALVSLAEAAEVLTEKRLEAAEILAKSIMDELAFLDMEKVRFSVSVKRRAADTAADTAAAFDDGAFGPTGCDSVEFLISTNPGEPLKPLERIASGGELSRIMLAAKVVMADTEQIRTMIFDEVDTGVSGKTSQKIGMKLKELGRSGSQVICVTHSAQIAALADTHLIIKKEEVGDRVETSVVSLDREGRIAELSRIIGGIEITGAIRKTAEEMLDTAKAL